MSPATDTLVSLNIGQLASAISQTPDPGAFLAQLAASVAAHAPDAAHQGRWLYAVKRTCEITLTKVRDVLIEYVHAQPGTYDGFVVYTRAGSRAVDYDRLHTDYPDVYDELVRTGKPTFAVKYVS